MNELQHYADRLDALVRQLEPAQIRKLTRELARTIRRSVKQRIAANQAPDGSAYAPRSGLQGRPLRKGEILRQDQPFIVGGELKGYTELLNEAREEAIARMSEQARQMGANAVVNVRFSTASVAAGAAEIFAYGTAVVIED